METNKLGVVFTVFIGLIIGIALLGVVADKSYEATHTITNSNETVDVSLTHSGSQLGFNETRAVLMDLADVKVNSIDQVRWSNGTILTANTDYVVTGYSTVDTENITIRLYNTTTNFIHAPISNTTVVDYTYYPASYIDNSTGRTLINSLVVLFFVLAILFGVIGYFGKERVFDFLGL